MLRCQAGNLWATTFPGKYLEGGKAGGGQIVDQRLLPRIVEGEIRLQMVKNELHKIIHKKPKGEHGGSHGQLRPAPPAHPWLSCSLGSLTTRLPPNVLPAP